MAKKPTTAEDIEALDAKNDKVAEEGRAALIALWGEDGFRLQVNRISQFFIDEKFRASELLQRKDADGLMMFAKADVFIGVVALLDHFNFDRYHIGIPLPKEPTKRAMRAWKRDVRRLATKPSDIKKLPAEFLKDCLLYAIRTGRG